MQNVQALSQPVAIETHARTSSPRAAGSALGNSLRVLAHVHLRPLALGALQQVEQVRQRVRADDDVDPRGLALDLALILLGETAGDDDPRGRAARP